MVEGAGQRLDVQRRAERLTRLRRIVRQRTDEARGRLAAAHNARDGAKQTVEDSQSEKLAEQPLDPLIWHAAWTMRCTNDAARASAEVALTAAERDLEKLSLQSARFDALGLRAETARRRQASRRALQRTLESGVHRKPSTSFPR